MACGRSTTARFFSRASMRAKNASMADRQRGGVQTETARCGLSQHVIEDAARRPTGLRAT